MSAWPGLVIAEFSHIGQRSENQDSHCVFQDAGAGTLLAVVADGMGGHAGGALAAQAVKASAAVQWQKRQDLPAQNPKEFLRRLIDASHAAVCRAGLEEGLGLAPGATFAALLLQRGKDGAFQGVSIHAGDARIIQYDDAGLVKHSIDHSMAQLHVMRGLITQEEAATHPDQRWVLAHVGGEDQPAGEFTHWDLTQGSRFVVCSDGFWEIFRAEEVLQLFQTASEPAALEEAVAALFKQKLASLKGQDNTTAILLHLEA